MEGTVQRAEAAVVVAVVAAALVFVPAASDIFGLPKLLAVAICTAAGWAAWWVSPRPIRPSPVPRTVGWAVAAYVAVVAVSTVTSRARLDSLLGSYERYGGLVPLLVALALAALVVTVFAGRPERLDRVVLAFVVAAAVLAVYVLVQAAGVDVLEWRDAAGNPVRFPAGTMGNPDFAGGWLGLSIPACAWWTVQARRWRALALLVDVVVLAGLVATRSRGGLLAAAVGLAVLGVLERERLGRAMRVALLGAGAAALVAVAVVSAARPAVVERSGLLRTESAEVRVRQWAGALKVFSRNPVLGTGPDTFEFAFPEVRSEEDGRELGLQIADKPHNLLLEKASDTGVLGLAAYVAVLVGVLGAARRGGTRGRVAAFTAMLAAWLAQAFVSIEVTPLTVAGWVTMAGVLAAAAPLVEGRRARVRAGTPPWSAAAPLAVIVVLAAGASAADLSAADESWGDAIRRHPWQPYYRFGAALEAERRGNTEAAVSRYREVLDAQPDNVLAMVGLARTFGGGRRFPEADQWWRAAAQHDPNDWEVHNGHALLLNAWANARQGDPALRHQAEQAFARTVEVKTDHVPAWVNLGRVRLAVGDRLGARQAADRARRLAPDDSEVQRLVGDVRVQSSQP